MVFLFMVPKEISLSSSYLQYFGFVKVGRKTYFPEKFKT